MKDEAGISFQIDKYFRKLLVASTILRDRTIRVINPNESYNLVYGMLNQLLLPSVVLNDALWERQYNLFGGASMTVMCSDLHEHLSSGGVQVIN